MRWLTPQSLDPEVGGSSPFHVAVFSVSLSKTYLPPKVLVIPRKLWLSPNMTEKLYWDFKHQTNKTKIRQEDLKTSGITLGLKTEGDTQDFQYILRDLINNDN